MRKEGLYIAEYYIESDTFICKYYEIMKWDERGGMVLDDDSIIYPHEVDYAEDNGTFIICPSFEKSYAINSVIKCACNRMTKSIQKLMDKIEN